MSDLPRHLRAPVLLVAATEIEAAAARCALGERAGFRLLVAGVGRAGAGSLRKSLASSCPGTVVALGLAGALAPGLEAGDVVLTDGWLAPEPPHAPGPSASPAATDAVARLLGEHGVRVERGPGVTVDAPFHGADRRDRVHAGSGALTVEMEGRRWAAAALEAGADFVSVRVISDRADLRLPRPRHELLDADGAVHWERWVEAARTGPGEGLHAGLERLVVARREWRAAMASLRRVSAALASAD